MNKQICGRGLERQGGHPKSHPTKHCMEDPGRHMGDKGMGRYKKMESKSLPMEWTV